jgi:hypothetical protein
LLPARFSGVGSTSFGLKSAIRCFDVPSRGLRHASPSTLRVA